MLGSFETGLAELYGWPSPILMMFLGCILLYLGIARKMEPLLLVPIGFGVVLTNLPLGGLMETVVDGRVVGVICCRSPTSRPNFQDLLLWDCLGDNTLSHLPWLGRYDRFSSTHS